jgi:hypothetical protein
VRQRRSVVGFHSEETSEFDHTTATRQDKTRQRDKTVGDLNLTLLISP